MAYSRPQPKGITHILKQKNTEKSDNTSTSNFTSIRICLKTAIKANYEEKM